MAVSNDRSPAVQSGESIQESHHGAIDPGEMIRRGIDPDQVIDFSTNINPFGPSPRVREAVCGCALERYPDRQCLRLRESIAAHEAVATDHIIVGNGSSELLQSLAQLLLRPGDKVLIMGPTYCEYARSARLVEAQVNECRATPESGFAIPVDAFDDALRQGRPNMAFLCNPNNPTGKVIEREKLLRWVDANRETWFVIDESYIDFAASADSVIGTTFPNLIVLRSMTKSYALAGLRLGYACADRDVIRRLCQRRVPWNVSTPAQVAGVAAMEDQAYLKSSLKRLETAKSELLNRLAKRGFVSVDSATNFFLLRVSDVAAVRESLLVQNLLVRDCTSFGIDNHIRIGVRTREENARLIDCI